MVPAEFEDDGALSPRLIGELLRPAESKRIGLALLRDAVEKALHCAGFDVLVAYYPPHRRGEVEDAVGRRAVWAEPTSGASKGVRLTLFLRHLLGERTYRDAVVLFPAFSYLARNLVFEASHALGAGGAAALGTSEAGAVGLIAIREVVPPGTADALDTETPGASLEAAFRAAGTSVHGIPLPPPIYSEEVLVRTVFDLRAAMATRTVPGDDLPLHTLELFDSLGLAPDLKADGTVGLLRAGPPRRPRT